MFEQLASGQGQRAQGYTAISVGVHAAIVFFALGIAAIQARQPARKEVEVSFLGPGKTKGAPPPPPPPAGKKHFASKRKPVLARAGLPRPVIVPRAEAPKEDPPEVEEDEGEKGGVEGGVSGGVVGGVVGSTGGGGGMAPPPEKPRAKNVPPFVIQRDLLRQTPIRLSEVFKQMHRGQPQVSGMYKVCVDTDGHIDEVTPLKPIPGADEDIIEGMKEGWLYKPQQVPVCFLYNVPITIQ